MTETNTERHRPTGRYAHALDRVCARCGLTKGEHEAEAPYAIGDAMVGDCEGFKAARKAVRP